MAPLDAGANAWHCKDAITKTVKAIAIEDIFFADCLYYYMIYET